jgi:hypothetical protein
MPAVRAPGRHPGAGRASFVAVRPSTAPAPEPSWFALRCSVSNGAVRAAVWRTLKKMEALNVQRSLWIVRDDPEQRARVGHLLDRVAGAGGSAAIAGDLDGADGQLVRARLQRACDRLWDDVADALEAHEVTAAQPATPLASQARSLAALTRRFTGLVGADLVGSSAGGRLEDGLRAAILELQRRAELEGLDDRSWRRAQPVVHRRAQLVTSFPLMDGRRSFVAAVHTHAEPLWELSFERFERAVYRDDDRIPLRAGAFRWVAEAGSDDTMIDALSGRIERFEATLG